MADPRNKPIALTFDIDQPPAGTNFSITPNTAADWLIRALTFTLTTDANVATRAVSMHISGGGSDYRHLIAGSTQVAGLARTYSGSEGTGVNATVGSFITLILPDQGIWLPNGHTMRVEAENIQAGDQFSDIAGYRFEFPLGPQSHVWPFIAVLAEESS